ncbi:MAG TPA: SRPBCC family protein [Steroidobacteraceae bacterium]|nr:SRPBCC family protein [Steroidobacteraceae bacterium]
MRPQILLVALLAASPAATAADAAARDLVDVHVVLDAGAQSGQASASLRIHASREAVWAVLTSCKDARELLPGLVDCEVLKTAPDASWQLIRQVVDYSWLVPKVSYVIRATYDYPARVSIERVSGDLRTLRSSWYLQADGEYTAVRYTLELTPGFWVPHWMMRFALKHDLPKMLRALRTRAESALVPAS